MSLEMNLNDARLFKCNLTTYFQYLYSNQWLRCFDLKDFRLEMLGSNQCRSHRVNPTLFS